MFSPLRVSPLCIRALLAGGVLFGLGSFSRDLTTAHLLARLALCYLLVMGLVGLSFRVFSS